MPVVFDSFSLVPQNLGLDRVGRDETELIPFVPPWLKVQNVCVQWEKDEQEKMLWSVGALQGRHHGGR